MQYEFRGFSKYISQYDDDKKEYELGKTEDEAREYMDRVQDFDKDSRYKEDYSFIGLPKSVKPTLDGYQDKSLYLANEIDNNLMTLDDGKVVANRSEDSFVATKVSDKTTLKKEKREDYKNDKIAGSYKISNN